MENEVSYRQVGREKGYVPPPRLKDEGVQRKAGGKRDAFGIRTERFSKPTNDVPPPGAYYRPSTMERDGRVCGSVSAKGFGSGFVSATPRFRDVKMLQEACLPGPGSYNAQPESGQEGGKLTSFSSLRRDCRLAPDQLTAAPGPGEYNIDRRDNPRIATGPTSSFRCTRTPLAVGTHLQTPAPGAYETLQGQHVQADKNGLILKDPFFRSQTKRSASFIASSDVPGPGEYDVDRGVATVKEACGTGAGGKGQGGVSAGRPGHQRCGHAREDEESSPGPGWYTPHQTKPQMRSSSSSSMFRSGTKRFSRSTVAGAPGPAFYQPEPLGKKSFRWNATKQWM